MHNEQVYNPVKSAQVFSRDSDGDDTIAIAPVLRGLILKGNNPSLKKSYIGMDSGINIINKS